MFKKQIITNSIRATVLIALFASIGLNVTLMRSAKDYSGLGKFIFANTVRIQSDLIIEKVNEIRQKNNLGRLRYDKTLTDAAQDRAIFLVSHNQWSHAYYEDQISKSGYRYEEAGENLARNFKEQDVVNAWMNSPKHKAIILNQNYKDIGIGLYKNYIVLWTGVTY